MSTKINVRSPFYKNVTAFSIAYATLELYAYEGTFGTDKPATPTYTITKNLISGNTYITFETSELIRDYFENTFDGTYQSRNLWVEQDIIMYNAAGGGVGSSFLDYVAFDAYGYFEEGVNPVLGSLLQSNRIIYRLNDSDISIPVDTNTTNSVSFFYQGVEKKIKTISTSTDSTNQIEYVTVSGINPYSTFQSRVLLNGGIYETSSCIEDFLESEDIGLVDEVYVASTDGVDIIKVATIDECKYTPYKVVFINKFGALQDMWFFKKNTTSINVESESYKSNIADLSGATVDYSTTAHQRQKFNINGNETLVLNSGYYDEDYNEVVRQLLLSEYVWVDNGVEILPVNVNTNSYTFQTSVNDKLIQHTLEFEYAFDKINSVR